MPTPTPSGTEFYWEWCNPLVILLVGGLVILGFAIFSERLPISFKRGRTRGGSPPAPWKSGRGPTLMAEGAASARIVPSGEFVPGIGPEQRASTRRKGKPVRIIISTDVPKDDPFLAWVINRSRGGVCIVATRQLVTGTTLSVRTVDAPDTTPWVQIEVQNCRSKGNRWMLGCKFTEELSWAVLLLFG